MKHLPKIFPGSLFLLLLAVQPFAGGCVADGYVSESIYDGPRYRDPWFRDEPWMDGRRWDRYGPRSGVGLDIYISPPRSHSRHP